MQTVKAKCKIWKRNTEEKGSPLVYRKINRRVLSIRAPFLDGHYGLIVSLRGWTLSRHVINSTNKNRRKYSGEFILLLKFHTLLIPIFWLVDFCHVTLGYDATTSLTSLLWCNSRGVNSIHHCHYTMASADLKCDDCCLQCIQFQ